MIVDDEEPVLESFSYMLKQGIEGFSLCAAARSGCEALQLCGKHHPDVVFMDIGMPGIDGLETIRLMQKEYPETVCILSTAYERFDLAKQAIPLKVFCYLVKPILKKTFRETLEQVKTFLDERQEQNQEYLECLQIARQSLLQEERTFVAQLPWMKISEEDWLKKREMFSLKDDYGVLVCISENALSEKQEAISFESLVEKVSYQVRCLWGVYQGVLVLLIVEDIELARLDTLLECNLGTCISPSKLCIWGRTERIHFKEFAHEGSLLIRRMESDQKGMQTSQKEIRMIMELRKSLAARTLESQARQLFDTLLERYLGSYELSIAKGKLIYCFALLLEDCFCCADKLEEPVCFDPAEEIMPIQDAQLVKKWAQKQYEVLVSEFFCRSDEHLPSPLQRAVSYINSNYNSQLQLTMVAQACKVSPAYLSRLFTEHLYTSFVEYLTRLRITKAEALLKEEDLSVKQISYEVGFHDPNYFSKIFRKYIGVSPKQYIQDKE